MRVVAMIVTHNRLALLRACVEAVRAQVPAPDRVVVVDNDSTDGTAQWLAAQPGLLVMRQNNCGPAGAYHTGFATALALRPDWIWSMDDDGRPEPGALAELLDKAGRHRLDLAGPLVVAKEDPGELAFQLRDWKRVEEAVANARDGVLPGCISLFNGSLVRRGVFERLGNVKREMFLWGEEWEYTLRARKAGLRDGTVVTARHVHPRNRRTLKPLLGGWLGHVEEMPAARAPFYFRNMGYIEARYEQPLAVPATLLRYTLHTLLHGDWAGLRLFYRHYVPGLFDRYPDVLRRPPGPPTSGEAAACPR